MSKNEIKFNLKDFFDLDNSSNVNYLIESMETHHRIDSVKYIKNRAIDRLDLKPGDTVIELGCGLGYDSNEIASHVGDNGTVIAVDISKNMISEAQKRSRHSNIIYCHGDACYLNFADNSFSACYADRLLVSQHDVDKILTEAIRVIKPQGKLCITDLDFGKLSFGPHLESITNSLIKHWQTLVTNPYIGRKLPALFESHDLREIEVIRGNFNINDYETLKKIVQIEVMLDDMIALKKISLQQKLSIISQLKRAEAEEKFLWSIELVTVVAKKSDKE